MCRVPWLPIVAFLEQLEFHPANDSQLRHPRWWIFGSLVVGVALLLVTWMGLWPPGVFDLDAGWAFLVHVLPFIAALSFWLSSLSAATLTRIFRRTERWMGAMDVWAQILLTCLSVVVGACFVVAVVTLWGTNWPVIVAFGVYLLIPPSGSLALGNGLRVGVVALRSRMWAATVARWARTIQFGMILVGVVAVIAQTDWGNGAVISVAVTLTAALVGFHRRQVKQWESAVDEFVGLLEAIRSAALSVDHVHRDEWTRGVYGAVRSLQIRLGARPRSVVPLIRSRSLSALCRIMDAKVTGRQSLGAEFLVGQHVQAGEALLRLDEEEMAMGAAQTADALIQQIDPGSSPAAHRGETEVRGILQSAALPVSAMTARYSETISSVPANTSPEAMSTTVV